jgi:hypothetical protein
MAMPYKGHALGTVEIYAREENVEQLLVAEYDQGTFIVRDRNPERGFGLVITHAIAEAVSFDTGNDGTRVQLLVDTSNQHGRVSAYKCSAIIRRKLSAMPFHGFSP